MQNKSSLSIFFFDFFAPLRRYHSLDAHCTLLGNALCISIPNGNNKKKKTVFSRAI